MVASPFDRFQNPDSGNSPESPSDCDSGHDSGHEANALSGTDSDDNTFGLPISDWLRIAISKALRRDALLAAEDGIMLVDITTALLKNRMTVDKVLSNPFVGQWLQWAVINSLNLPKADLIRETTLLRDLLVSHAIGLYQDGLIKGQDVDIRLCNIVEMLWGIGTDTILSWSKNAAPHLQSLAQAKDAGLSHFNESIESENAKGRRELADIMETVSFLDQKDLKRHLLQMSEALAALRRQKH
jgi:hypothetical protein